MPYTVRLTTDKLKLHAFLQRDPIWAAYAIGDLEPVYFSWCTWHVAEDAAGRLAGLALLYYRLDPPVLLTVGETAAVAAILAQMALPQQVYVSAREEHLPLLLARYDFSADRVRPMLRMAVTAETLRPAAVHPSEAGPVETLVISSGRIRDPAGLDDSVAPRLASVSARPNGDPAPTMRRLDSADVPAIEALIAHGGPFAPDAFTPSQVDEGVFFGVELTDAGLAVLGRTVSPAGGAPPLLAVAGTHLVAPAWGVAAVGNVYVHPAWRGRGYGALVSSAVTAELLQRDLLVVLNVDQNNPAAINLYRQLGFVEHCPFVEGIAVIRNT